MFKKLLSILLAVILTVGCLSVTAFAEKATAETTFHYVALGDSIAAGYGLSENQNLSHDPSLVITEELLASPVRGAYPALFGEYLSTLGQERGYTVTTTNLSQPAYRAQDVADTILIPGYKGEIAAGILETYLGAGASEPMERYHDLFVSALEEADLVTLQLGINDISEGIVSPMTTSDNLIIRAIGSSMALILFGVDPATAIAAGRQIIESNRDQIDEQTTREALAYIDDIIKHPEVQLDNAAAQVRRVVEAVKTVNPDAEVVIVGQFNIFGNSLELDGEVYDIHTVLRKILVKSAIYLASYEGRHASIDERRARFAAIVSDEILYPMQYLLLGRAIGSNLLALNERLQAVAKETGSTYVDIYDISNKKGLDPHPDAEGHKEIAEILAAELTELALARMPELPEPVTVLLGDADGNGEITVVDATVIQRYLEGLPCPVTLNENAADVDGSGEIDINDATFLLRFESGIDTPYAIGKPF